MDVMSKVLKLKLARIFVTTSERDTFVSLFTRPVYLILESEARVKNNTIRMHTFKVLCIAVKHHGHAFGPYLGKSRILYILTFSSQARKPPSSRTCPTSSTCPSPWLNFFIFWPTNTTIPS